MPRPLVYRPRQTTLLAGVTLVELLICLAIVSILSFIVVPSFHDIYQNARSNSHINQLSQLIRFTRSEALGRQARVTLCPSTEGLICEQEWHEGTMIFIDENNDQERSEGEVLLRLKTPFISTGTVHFNNPVNRLVFSRQGFPLGTSGSFIYCPESNNVEYSRALIINFQGRLRVGVDSNEDGVVETTVGRNVSCS